MLTLDNECGVLGDVSYLSPDSHAYALPDYWLTTLWGSQGMARTSYNASGVTLYRNGQNQVREIPPLEPSADDYLKDFLMDMAGLQPGENALTTTAVLHASRIALQVQHAADNQLYNVNLK